MEFLSKQCGNNFISKHSLERIPKPTIYTFPPCSFLSEVNEFFYDKRSKNLAMMENLLSSLIHLPIYHYCIFFIEVNPRLTAMYQQKEIYVLPISKNIIVQLAIYPLMWYSTWYCISKDILMIFWWCEFIWDPLWVWPQHY